MRLPTRLDRYPAKMVGRLADDLIVRYAKDATRLLDPFCGSGAVLRAASCAGIAVTGVDINPIGVLLSRTKLRGFDCDVARDIAETAIRRAIATRKPAKIDWTGKSFWFTPKTLDKFERLRAGLLAAHDAPIDEKAVVLLSLALSVRLCSRADQRSPKPFISATAREERRGRHYDPYVTVRSTLAELSGLYGGRKVINGSTVLMADFVRDETLGKKLGFYSHVVTSPPYINAQDYFRNFKLELHVLEGLLPFRVDSVKDKFIGTDRGTLLGGIGEERRAVFRTMIRGLRSMELRSPRLAAVVHRYLYDMDTAFDAVARCLAPNGKFVLVCGDNLVSGLRIRTWEVLQRMLAARGFAPVDTFRDHIRDRLLAPKRSGHKGLIKEEVVCCYQRAQ
ncbi:hypothetical protein SH661x_004339 [Planctomicrobium sp. SH661]|uniref:hypothetical protein n=1 Tax=Planctomicrobium sp. SH661 TaxID=3448124 RepID=UPI003F5BC7B3